MPFVFGTSPSAGSQIKVSISSTMTIINGCEGIPAFGGVKGNYETTPIDATAKTFADDVPDPGEITLTGTWDSLDPGQAHLLASSQAIGTVDAFEVDFTKKPGASTAAKATFNAYVLGFQVATAKNKAQMFTAKIKLTGPVTVTATT